MQAFYFFNQLHCYYQRFAASYIISVSFYYKDQIAHLLK